MPIPELDARGVLPPGLYGCSLAEIYHRFGMFQGTDQRVRLWKQLEKYAAEARSTGLVRALVVDGSFITIKPAPSDIDLVVVLARGMPDENLRPFEYNAISKRRIRKSYPFDVFVAEDGSIEYREYLAFFAQVKEQPGEVKGLLRVEL